MQPIQLTIAALLGLIVLAYVLYPLYRHPATQSATNTPTAKLSDREQNARQSLQEVEFDYQLGNLDEKDYRSMRTRYLNRAAVEMKNRQHQEETLDSQIEEELRKLKEADKDGQA